MIKAANLQEQILNSRLSNNYCFSVSLGSVPQVCSC